MYTCSVCFWLERLGQSKGTNIAAVVPTCLFYCILFIFLCMVCRMSVSEMAQWLSGAIVSVASLHYTSAKMQFPLAGCLGPSYPPN